MYNVDKLLSVSYAVQTIITYVKSKSRLLKSGFGRNADIIDSWIPHKIINLTRFPTDRCA